jgi:hypothetical protein
MKSAGPGSDGCDELIRSCSECDRGFNHRVLFNGRVRDAGERGSTSH